MRFPEHARKELSAYLDCGLLCRGLARLRCGECGESRLVAFSCKGRGFCPSCLAAGFCACRAAREGVRGAQAGTVTVAQRTSSDLRLNPHLHPAGLDGAWHEQSGEP